MKVTVFTPSYNRGELLYTLFNSLESQTCKEFEWLIVDDGSIDNTEQIANELKNKASFAVNYVKKENGGKHTAINVGAQMASAPWFFIVDSDDFLTTNAIEVILQKIEAIANDASFAGVVGLRGDSNGGSWETWFKKDSQMSKSGRFSKNDYVDATCIEYRYRHKRRGDRAEVVRTDLVRKYPFPKFDNEKFLVETHLWYNLAKDGYKFRWFDEIIYITEYREDGLTKNIAKAYKNSPKGSVYTANLVLSCKGIPLMTQVRSIYNYFSYGKIAGYKVSELVSKCNKKYLAPVGLLLSCIKSK